MNKGLWGAGLGLLSILIVLAVAGQMTKQEAAESVPAMEAAFRGANTANLASMNMARTLYMQAKGSAPEKVEDLVPQYLERLPNEAFSKSNAVVAAYDGSGGWVLDADGFRPNHPQTLDVPKKP